MTEKVGIFRSGDALEQAVAGLQALLERSRHIGVRTGSRGANPELVAAYRVQRMLKLALCVAYGALCRTESRGAHFRDDYPMRNDRDWLKRTLAIWPDDTADMPELRYEDIDVMRMELPPGWRGYGRLDHIEHPDALHRQAQIDAIRTEFGARDRFAVQERLLPYRHLLPEHLRGRNERLEEPLDV